MTAIPINANGTHNVPTWGESGTFSDSAYLGTGAPDGTLVGENDFNTFKRHVARWVRAIRERMVWSDAALFGSFILPGSGSWSTGGGTLNGTLDPAWVMIDADDDGGVVVSFNVALASPHLFTASRDTYVNLNEDGDVEYQEEGLGNPSPTPTAGYVAVWKVVTDGTEITTVTRILPAVPLFKDVRAESLLITGTLDTQGAAAFGSTVVVTGTTTLNGSSVIGDTAGDTCTVYATLTVNNNSTIGSSGADTCQVNAVTTFISAVSFNGDVTLGNASGDSITCTGTIVASVAVTLAGGTTPAMTCTGAVGSGTSDGFNAVAMHADADACKATTAATASTNANALYGLAANDGTAVRGLAANGYAGHFTNDTSSPTRATLFIAPADNDPSTPTHGDFYHSSTRGNGKLCFYDASSWQRVHSSAKGFVRAWTSAAASGTETAGAGNELAGVTITPEQATGDILVTATGSLTFAADTSVVLITIYDTTSNSDVASQYERAPDIDAGVTRTRSFVIRGIKALPSAAARTFVFKIGAADDVDYTNVIVSAEGIQ